MSLPRGGGFGDGAAVFPSRLSSAANPSGRLRSSAVRGYERPPLFCCCGLRFEAGMEIQPFPRFASGFAHFAVDLAGGAFYRCTHSGMGPPDILSESGAFGDDDGLGLLDYCS